MGRRGRGGCGGRGKGEEEVGKGKGCMERRGLLSLAVWALALTLMLALVLDVWDGALRMAMAMADGRGWFGLVRGHGLWLGFWRLQLAFC